MEKISELMDGELDSREVSVHLKRLKEEPSLRENWDLYHFVGDAIRQEGAMAGRIAKGVSARLEREPTIMAPRFTAPRRVMRYAMSAAAGLAGIAVVGWVALQDAPLGQAPQQMAATSPAPVKLTPPTESAVQTQLVSQDPAAIASQDAQVEDYLLAHQSVSAFTTMHGSLPYIRAVAAESSKE